MRFKLSGACKSVHRVGCRALAAFGVLIFSLSSHAGDLAAPDGVTLAAGPAGSILARQAESLGKILTERLHLPVTLRTTSGSPQSLNDVDQRDADLALVRMSAVWEQRRTALNPLRAVQAIAPWQRFSYLILVPRTAPGGLGVLQNAKRVGLGPPQSGAEGLMRPIYETAGLKPQLTIGAIPSLFEQLGSGTLDAVVIAQARDGAWGIDLAAIGAVQPLAPGEDDDQSVIGNLPHVSLVIAPAPLPFAAIPSRQLATWAYLVAHRDLAPDFVARLTELIVTLPPVVGDGPRQLNDIQTNRLLPLHPGAVRYYREKSIRLSPDLLPTDGN